MRDPLFFSARRTVLNCKASVMHNAAIEFQIGSEMDFFFASLWLELTLFRSLTLPEIAQVTTEDLDEMRTALFFFSSRRTVLNCKASVTHNAPIEFQIGQEMDFFRFCLARTDIF